MTEAPRIAFKVTGLKRPLVKTTVPSLGNSESTTTNNDQPELITSVNNGQIESNARTIVKEELVIPSQPNTHQRFGKVQSKSSNQSNNVPTDPVINQLDDEAKRALILEAEQANESWNERGTTSIGSIEQTTKNSFAINGKEEKDDEEKIVENANYDLVAIEDFGMAVLRGMGYKEDTGLGISNKKQVDVFVPECRPRGLGLGADRKILENINQLKRNAKKSGIDEKDDLCFEKGAHVLIQKGSHTDQYGTIESIDEDVSRLTVALAISGSNKKKEVISISQYNVKLVTSKEFLKYSKYVNKSKAEQVEKETTEKLMKEHRHSKKSRRD